MVSARTCRNDATEMVEFLSHLTLKTQQQKNEFFESLVSRLLSLSSNVVAEHLIPLLLTPLTMAEPLARRYGGTGTWQYGGWK